MYPLTSDYSGQQGNSFKCGGAQLCLHIQREGAKAATSLQSGRHERTGKLTANLI